MRPKLLRLAYAFEFLIAVVAVFTAWSEIGGQAALDLMHWGWKLGLGLGMAGALVAYTASMISGPSAWNLRSARWLTAIIVIAALMGVVTYYYVLQEGNSEDSEETGTISLGRPLKELSSRELRRAVLTGSVSAIDWEMPPTPSS